MTEAPPVELDPQLAQYLELFKTNWKSLLARAPEAQERNAFTKFEQLFVETGEYLRFVDILEKMRRGANLVAAIAPHLPSPAAEALATRVDRVRGVLPLLVHARWNLGATDAADVLSETLLEQLPENPDVHMVRALVIELEGSLPNKRVDIESLRFHAGEVVRLDPQYEGFGMTAAVLRERIGQIDARFGPPPKQRVDITTRDAVARTLGRKVGRRIESHLYRLTNGWRQPAAPDGAKSGEPGATGEATAPGGAPPREPDDRAAPESGSSSPDEAPGAGAESPVDGVDATDRPGTDSPASDTDPDSPAREADDAVSPEGTSPGPSSP